MTASKSGASPLYFGKDDVSRRRQQNRKSAQASRSRRSHEIRSMRQDVEVISHLNGALNSERAALMAQQRELRRKMAAMQLLLQEKMGLDVTSLFDDVSGTAGSTALR